MRVETQPVDHAAIGVEAKQARARIAGLRPRRNGAGLDKAEAEPQQHVRHFRILVETRRHADRVGKIQSEGAHREPRIVARTGQHRREFQKLERERVSIFRIKRVQERPDEMLERGNHETSSGKARRPSISSASGRAHNTADNGSAA